MEMDAAGFAVLGFSAVLDWLHAVALGGGTRAKALGAVWGREHTEAGTEVWAEKRRWGEQRQRKKWPKR